MLYVGRLVLTVAFLLHPAYLVSFFAGFTPSGEVFVHKGMEAGIMARF
jgi:hypothetical protein